MLDKYLVLDEKTRTPLYVVAIVCTTVLSVAVWALGVAQEAKSAHDEVMALRPVVIRMDKRLAKILERLRIPDPVRDED